MTCLEIFGVVIVSLFAIFVGLVAYSCVHLSGTISRKEEEKKDAVHEETGDS